MQGFSVSEGHLDYRGWTASCMPEKEQQLMVEKTLEQLQLPATFFCHIWPHFLHQILKNTAVT